MSHMEDGVILLNHMTLKPKSNRYNKMKKKIIPSFAKKEEIEILNRDFWGMVTFLPNRRDEGRRMFLKKPKKFLRPGRFSAKRLNH